MDSESPSKLCERLSNACHPWSFNQNDVNTCHSPQTQNRTAMHASNLSTGPCRLIALNESSNQALGEMTSPVKATHVEKHFESSRMPTSNESSEQDENQASINHDSHKRNVQESNHSVQESNHDAETKTKKHKAGDIRTFFSGLSAQSSTKRKNGSKKKESRTAPKKNRGQVDFYFLPKVDGGLKSPSIPKRSSQQKSSDSQDSSEVDVTPLKSQSISQLKSPHSQDSEVDVPPLINRNQEFDDLDDFDDFEDDEDAHSFELQDSNSDSDSDSDSDEETCDICIYKPHSLGCPVRLKKLEMASKQCVGNLMEDGNVTNPKSENFKHVKYDSFYQNYKRCAVYIHEGLDKIGSTCEFQKRMSHYKNKNKESCETVDVTLMITCDSLTKEQCDKIEKSRKECLKSMGGVPTEPKSLLEILDNPFFHLGIYAHFSEEHDHTYLWKRQDVSYIESGLQFLMGYGDQKESMHEFCASDHEAFCKNYEFCSKKAAFLSKKMKEKSDLDMEDLKLGEVALNWAPGTRTGQAKNHLHSTIVIAKTFHEQFSDMFPNAILESKDIDDCYDTKHL